MIHSVIVIASHCVDRQASGAQRAEQRDRGIHFFLKIAHLFTLDLVRLVFIGRLVNEIARHQDECRALGNDLVHDTSDGRLISPPHTDLEISDQRDLLAFPGCREIRNGCRLSAEVDQAGFDRNSPDREKKEEGKETKRAPPQPTWNGAQDAEKDLPHAALSG